MGGRHHPVRANRVGHDLRDGHRAAPAGPPVARRRGARPARRADARRRRAVVLALASARRRVGAHRPPRPVQLRVVLPAARRRRLPVARRRRRRRRRPAAADRCRPVLAAGRSAPAAARPRCRHRGDARRRAHRRPARRRHRRRRRARSGGRQRVLRRRRGPDEALPGAAEPDRCDRLAAAAQRRAARAPLSGRRGPTTASDGPQPRRLRVPRPDRDRRRVRRMVRRDSTPADGGAAVARSRRAGHRCAARVARAGSIPVDDPARRLRRHARSDRLRRGARRRSDVNARRVKSARPAARRRGLAPWRASRRARTGHASAGPSRRDAARRQLHRAWPLPDGTGYRAAPR